MLMQPIADRLKESVPELRKVAGAADFAAAREDLKNTAPAAWVIPLSDSAGPNGLLGAVAQKVSERFGVVLAVRNAADARGDAANAALEAVRAATITGLLGFAPAAEYDPVQYGGGRLLMLDAPVIWWQLEFTTGYWERNV